MTTVLVCGSRDYADRAHFYNVMDELHRQWRFALVVSGSDERRPGADGLAQEWAKSRGIDRCMFPYNSTRGRAGGPHRNRLQYRVTQPRIVVAFPGGNGTASMLDVAHTDKAAGAEVDIIEVPPKR